MKTENSKSFDYRSIRTFSDACRKTGKSYFLNRLIIFLIKLLLPREFGKAIVAIYRLMIVYKAVNDSWRPEWSNNSEGKYYPWKGVLSSGSGFSFTHYCYVHSRTFVGSRLCTDTGDKAMYVGEQFEPDYIDWQLYV